MEQKAEERFTIEQKAYLYYSKIAHKSKYGALKLISRDGHTQLWVPPSVIENHDINLKQIEVKDWFIPKIKWELIVLPSKKTGASVIIREEAK